MNVSDWIAGRLSSEARIGSALGPAVLVALYLLIAWLLYAARTRRSGAFRDAEIARRGSSIVLPMRTRHFFAWAAGPVFRLAARSGLSANAISVLSGLFAVAASFALAGGRFALGGWLYLASGLCDFVDGRHARATGQVGPRGAAIDSIIDRYGDSAVLVGLAWFYRDSWVLLAVIAALVGSMLVSYVRARGEGLGTPVTVGVMQRPERVVVLGLALALSPIVEALRAPAEPRPMHWLAVLGIVVVAVGSHVTAAHRFAWLVRALPASESRPEPSRPVRLRFGTRRIAAAPRRLEK